MSTMRIKTRRQRPKARRPYYAGMKRTRRIRRAEYNEKVQRALNNHSSKVWRTSLIGTLDSTNFFDITGSMFQVPQYQPAGALPLNLVSATRTHERIWVKGMTIRFSATTNVQAITSQPIMIRTICLYNSSPNETLDVVNLTNLFEDTGKQDQAPSQTTNTLYVQKVNEDLYRGPKKANVWLDKKMVLGKGYSNAPVDRTPVTFYTKYIKLNRLVEFETSPAGVSDPKIFSYWAIMYSTPSGSAEGDIKYHAEFDLHYVED